jgi:D-3-phosphoglycerate dehydrogenase
MKVVYTDNGFGDVKLEQNLVDSAGGRLVAFQCKTEEDVIEAGSGADVLLVQWAPVTKRVIETLNDCRLIVRIGIGVDNIDLGAARARGIDVCNVPDYCTDEVADHTIALALTLIRQIPQVDARTRSGTWSITPDRSISALRQQTFVTIGLGRIARAVHERARGFGFKAAAVDPLLQDSDFVEAGIQRLTLDDAFQQADVLSLHCGLTRETHHMINRDRLESMKPSSILLNTSRGGLVDAQALASALAAGRIGGAGLDVYDEEPLAPDSPLRNCPNTILTSHVAWYSTDSIVRLRAYAAEEVARMLRGEPLKNIVN